VVTGQALSYNERGQEAWRDTYWAQISKPNAQMLKVGRRP